MLRGSGRGYGVALEGFLEVPDYVVEGHGLALQSIRLRTELRPLFFSLSEPELQLTRVLVVALHPVCQPSQTNRGDVLGDGHHHGAEYYPSETTATHRYGSKQEDPGRSTSRLVRYYSCSAIPSRWRQFPLPLFVVARIFYATRTSILDEPWTTVSGRPLAPFGGSASSGQLTLPGMWRPSRAIRSFAWSARQARRLDPSALVQETWRNIPMSMPRSAMRMSMG